MQSKKVTELKTIPFQGGMNTYNEPAMLPAGSYSYIQNMRQMKPGFKQRPGYLRQHGTADSTNRVMSMFQFSKGKRTEKHFYAQMSDGDILEAYANPPSVVEVLNLDVSPATAWAAGDTITGVSSGATCTIISYLTATTYRIKDRAGTYTLGEVLTNGTYTADQGATRPTFTASEFGEEVFNGTTVTRPGTWGVINDMCLFSDGVNQHKICAGTDNYISYFAVYDSDTKLPDVPAVGYDYTSEVSDASPTTVGVLDGLGNFVATTGTVTCTNAGTDFQGSGTKFLTELTVGQPVYVDAAEKNYIATITSDTVATVTTAWAAGHAGTSYTTSNDCVLICSQIMPNRITFTVSAANGNASVATISYTSTSGWKTVTLTDGTISSGKTFAVSGSMTWTQPTDAAPKYMYGLNGFWVKISFSAALDAEVEVSSVTYGSGFTSIQNVWDGSLVDAIEAQLYKNSTTAYYIYGTTAINIAGMTANDELYFNSPDPITAIYADVSGTPNTTASTTIDHLEYLNPAGSWTSVGAYTDGSSGFSKSGYITFGRQASISPMQFNGLPYNSYWYRLGVDKTLSASANLGIQVIPYYDIADFGVGICSAVWKDRVAYAFDQDPSYLYISATDNPQAFYSTDSAIYPIGDGRSNKIVAMRQFYNELLICQEEKGAAGGCITLLQGTTPEDLGKIVLSTVYGAMNANAMEVVETIEGGHNAFILSRKGILFTDGKVVNFVPDFDKIKNYFDPTSSACIRTGYESKMYLKYDSSYHVLKIGLTSGSSATDNNVFLVYDLITKVFSIDSYANNFACECEAEAGSGNVPVVQVAGGQADGTVYVLNSGLNDISTAVNSYATIELNIDGGILRNSEMIIRAKAQAAGNMTVTPYHNGAIQSSLARTLSLTAENSGDVVRRHKIPLNFKSQNISVKIGHNTVSESFYLLDWAAALQEYMEQ